jgi:hypothetical protein
MKIKIIYINVIFKKNRYLNININKLVLPLFQKFEMEKFTEEKFTEEKFTVEGLKQFMMKVKGVQHDKICDTLDIVVIMIKQYPGIYDRIFKIKVLRTIFIANKVNFKDYPFLLLEVLSKLNELKYEFKDIQSRSNGNCLSST